MALVSKKFVFIHGLAGMTDDWAEVAEILSGRGHSSICPYTNYLEFTGDFAADTATIKRSIPQEYLQGDAFVVGNSLGAAVGIELVNHFAKSISLAGYFANEFGVMSIRRINFPQLFDQNFHGEQRYDLKDKYVKHWEVRKEKLGIKKFIMALRAVKLGLDGADMDAKVAANVHKLHFLIPEFDQMCSPELMVDIATRNNVPYSIIENTGHAANIEAPELVADRLDQITS